VRETGATLPVQEVRTSGWRLTRSPPSHASMTTLPSSQCTTNPWRCFLATTFSSASSCGVPLRIPSEAHICDKRSDRGRKLNQVRRRRGIVISEENVGSIIIGRLPQTGEGSFSQAIPVYIEQGDIGTKEAGSLWLIFNRSTVDVEISQTASGDVVTLIPSGTGHLIQPTDHNVALSARLT
jgi:hypothetical protein